VRHHPTLISRLYPPAACPAGALSHHLNAHAFALLRDVDRLGDARRRLNVSPLGAGAIAGTSLNIDPAQTADLLGFDSVFANSMGRG